MADINPLRHLPTASRGFSQIASLLSPGAVRPSDKRRRRSVRIAAHHSHVVLIDQQSNPRSGMARRNCSSIGVVHQIADVVATNDRNIHLFSDGAANCSVQRQARPSECRPGHRPCWPEPPAEAIGEIANK